MKLVNMKIDIDPLVAKMLRERLLGLDITMEYYIAALLTVQVVEMEHSRKKKGKLKAPVA